MKTLGLIGGTTWHSTQHYYRFINEGINKKLGGYEYARLIMHSMNFGELKKNTDAGNLEANFKLIATACENMKEGGAKGIVLCANTLHMYAGQLEEKIKLPVIHIATATANEIKRQNLKKVALLGTKFTMEKDFFTNKLKEQNIEALIPNDADRDFIHWTIFEELGKGIINPGSKRKYIGIINQLISQGAQGVILGCTEIPMLIQQDDLEIPAFDTTKIHSDAAVVFAVGNNLG